MGRDPELPKHALTGIHVLVVEQERGAATVLSTILTHSGALVTLVYGVDEAAAMLARVTPDIVISDLATSGQAVVTLARTIRTRGGPGRPGTIAILTQDESAEPVLAAGFDAYLTRPLDAWELCAVVAGVARRAL
jgi:DNA-binding response OmpR family regulator